MKSKLHFTVFIITLGLAISANLVNAQGIYLHDQEPCGVSPELGRESGELPEGYLPICTDPNQIKYVRIAVHFLLPGKIIKLDIPDCDTNGTIISYIGLGNFTETGDGFTNSGYNGYQRAEDIINQANAELEDNEHQWRKANDPNVQNPPLNITYPANPPEVKVRYLLTGVYFHRDEAAYYLQNTRAQIHAQYGVSPATTINVYYTPNGNWSGIANTFGGVAKYVFNNDYFAYVKPACRNWSLTYSGSILNHEIGHTLGLRHTWNEDDNCTDTPLGYLYDEWSNGACTFNQRANCWSYDLSIPTCPTSNGGRPCDEWYKISNNLMDYNQYAPHAVTECQIAQMNADLTGSGNMFVHSCNGCMPSVAFFQLPDVYNICPSPLPGVAFFLNGTASFNENRWLIDICEVDPANPNTCINNINTGWNTGTIGKVNLLSFYTFQVNKHYRIKLIVDNSECPPSSEFSKVIEVKGCIEPEYPDEPSIEFAATNPFNDYLTVFYSISAPGTLQIRLLNINTANISTLLEASEIEAGNYQLVLESGSIDPGSYSFQLLYNNHLFTKTIIKP